MPKKPRPPQRPHDPVYRRIFSNARMIEDVLRRFVTGPWLPRLDFSTLELVPARYVSRFLDERESDIVWRLRYGPPGKEDWFYVYVLMELQSSVQRFMALRLWAYIALFYSTCSSRSTAGKVRKVPKPEEFDRLAACVEEALKEAVSRFEVDLEQERQPAGSIEPIRQR